MEKECYHHTISSAVQEALFTLDNAKVILLLFNYNFISPCFDHNRFHLIEGDTGSLYFTISGDKNHDCNQQFKHIIIDQELYDQLVYDWFPNPNLGMEDEKKLLGLTFENHGVGMIAVACKCSCLMRPPGNEVAKSKGVSKRNWFSMDCYRECLREDIIKKGLNVGFRTIKIKCDTLEYQPIKYQV
jgi:hypothetical protein